MSINANESFGEEEKGLISHKIHFAKKKAMTIDKTFKEKEKGAA